MLSATPVWAEGYQVNTLSARQNGMGHTGVAMKLNAESMIFNPAGLGFMNRTIDFSGSVTGIFATATATMPDGKKYTTDNNPSTPLSLNLGMNIYDNLKAGISFYTPYGSGINWGINWPGSVLNQSVSLKAYTVQPTLAWRILPNLSVGAGAMITWGTVNLDKGLVPTSSFNAMTSQFGIPPISDTPASINLSGKAAVTAGVHVGVMWDITDRWTAGVSYRQKMGLRVKCGTASINYASEQIRSLLETRLSILDQANFTAEMPAAAVYNIGISYRPVDKLILALDAQLTGWNTYKNLTIDFLSDVIPAAYETPITKDYRNSWTFHLGGQYSLTERMDLRAGVMVDTTPVNSRYYNPETPGMTKIEPSVGFSFSPVSNFSIDAALLYVAGLGAKNRSCKYPDLIGGTIMEFTADYNVHAWNPAIGLSYRF